MPEIDAACSRAGIPLLAVAVTGRPADAVRAAAKLHAATVLVAKDATLDALAIDEVPVTLILRDGKSVARIDGPIDERDFTARLSEAQRDRPPPGPGR